MRNALAVIGAVDIHLATAIGAIEQAREGSCSGAAWKPTGRPWRSLESPANPVELGFRPGPEFSEALGFAHKLQLAGVEKEEALSQTKGFLKKHPLLGEGGTPKA